MSWPLMLTTVSNSLVGLVDVKVAMKLGSSSQAAVGIAEHIVFLFMIFLMSAAVGTTALVSRAFGAKDDQLVLKETAQSISLSIILGLALSSLCLILSGPLMRFLTPSSEVSSLCARYLQIYCFLLIPFSLVCIINAAFRAAGNARTPLIIVGVMTIINILGDFLTIYGNWPVANLGVKGIAWSGFVATLSGGALAVYLIWRSNLGDSLKQLLPLHYETIKRVLAIGLPSAFQRLAWALSLCLVLFILKLCDNPTSALASLSIGMRVEGLLFMPLLALTLAISSIVGQNLGAKQPDRAFKAGWHIACVGVGLMLVFGLAMFIFADNLARIMSVDPNTINFTASYLRANALAEPMLALGMILGGALQGAGDTKSPMWITFATQWAVRLPLAWFLALYLKMGPIGAWIAMAASVCCMALLIVMRYQSRAWIKIRV